MTARTSYITSMTDAIADNSMDFTERPEQTTIASDNYFQAAAHTDFVDNIQNNIVYNICTKTCTWSLCFFYAKPPVCNGYPWYIYPYVSQFPECHDDASDIISRHRVIYIVSNCLVVYLRLSLAGWWLSAYVRMHMYWYSRLRECL